MKYLSTVLAILLSTSAFAQESQNLENVCGQVKAIEISDRKNDVSIEHEAAEFVTISDQAYNMAPGLFLTSASYAKAKELSHLALLNSNLRFCLNGKWITSADGYNQKSGFFWISTKLERKTHLK